MQTEFPDSTGGASSVGPPRAGAGDGSLARKIGGVRFDRQVRDRHRHDRAFRFCVNQDGTFNGLGHEAGEIETEAGAGAATLLLELVERARKEVVIDPWPVIADEEVDGRAGFIADRLH